MDETKLIAQLRETWIDYKTSTDLNDIGKLNLVAFMGERMGSVLACIDRLTADLAALRAERQWIPVGVRLPDTSETGWSEYVQLAYKVVDMPYHGMQIVSRYHHDLNLMEMVWDYGNTTLDRYGYEAYAWKPLGPGPEA